MNLLATRLLEKKIIPVIAGPTGAGKSQLAVELATKFSSAGVKCIIISADSRQIYKYLDIGTAKTLRNEMKGIPHQLMDFLELDEKYSSGQFAFDAGKIIEDSLAKAILPIICGGTGFYIESLFKGLDTDIPRSEELKKRVYDKYSNLSREDLYEVLRKIDPVSADKFSDKNPVRVLRAIEFFEQTGSRYSSLFSKPPKEIPLQPYYIFPEYIVEKDLRKVLYDRINTRCIMMWNHGLVDETKASLSILGLSKEDIITTDDKLTGIPNSLNTVGYKEAIMFLKGELNQEQAIDLFKRNTRRYAKRQITWFRRVLKTDNDNSYIVKHNSTIKVNQILENLEQYLFSMN